MTTILLAVVVFSFFFCWIPFHTQRLMFALVTLYSKWTKSLLRAQHIIFMISGIFELFADFGSKELIVSGSLLCFNKI